MLFALILYMSGATYSLTSTPKDTFWETFSVSELLPEICWEKIAEEIFFFSHSVLVLTWDTNLGFTCNKPKHYLLDCDDYNIWRYFSCVVFHFLKNIWTPTKFSSGMKTSIFNMSTMSVALYSCGTLNAAFGEDTRGEHRAEAARRQAYLIWAPS